MIISRKELYDHVFYAKNIEQLIVKSRRGKLTKMIIEKET